MIFIKFLKHWKLVFPIVMLKLLTISAAFASMGSTGGGSGGSTSGGTSSSSSYSGGSSSGDTGGDNRFFLLIIGIYLLYHVIKKSILLIRETNDNVKVNGLDNWMLTPNMTISSFNSALKKNNIKLMEGKKLEDELSQSLIDTYAKAQFNYGEAIRRCFTNNSGYLDILKQQLGHTFLVTMKKEIKNKAMAGVVDDVIVNHGKIISAKVISPDLIIAKVQVIGTDNEVNVLSHFDSSFKRKRWTDYVVFGRNKDNPEWKIYNIIYGAHFHLNGEDYNEQPSLDKSSITEQHLTVSPELVKAAKSYQQQAALKKRIRTIIIVLVVGVILIFCFAPELIELWLLFRLFLDLFPLLFKMFFDYLN
ncbi:hypothetical protein [Limosilactobacillus fastidiosus]|uniref:Tim44-like domain-containing protein n=2 Tax=Limosilactobacillus fastidiosus TaxID=2759855 RepID=A0A7W3U0D2_9LACO|nr:hypothetical protein [Limosilactobacillus fastidiosus]MCD7086435.1 hypothetical protein [Limosilactobacillus fastidiosus]MCD7114209.1 hypothetical protein [Limosilactobacillus fastidiosus]MCD7116116.1 hypothetical protein [Limosilactobacillus fastidiosus]